MAERMDSVRVGRGYLVSVYECDSNTSMDPLIKYSVVFEYGGRPICTMSNKCIGIKSAKHWMNYHAKNMRRLMHLFDGIDMAEHNIRCYDRSGMKEEYKEQVDKLTMLKEWVIDMINSYGTEYNNERRTALVDEFNEYY